MPYEVERAKKWMKIKLAGRPNVVSHIKKVTEKALEIGKKLKENGYRVDLELLETGGYLHDIGRSVTHGVWHGFESSRIVKELGFSEPVVKLVERHMGAGITAEEAAKLGLPRRDFIPQTLEEKILSYADKFLESDFVFNTVDDEQVVDRKDLLYDSIEPTLDRFRKLFGKNSPIVLRLEKLRDEMENLLRQKNIKFNA
jgi:uncharacterized protein